MPSQPAPFAQPQQPSPFAQPPAPSSDPFALPPQPMGAAAPEGLRPAAPVGVVKRAAPGAGFGGGKTFAGTIMGTMVFLAKSRSVPLAAKIGGVVILVAAVVATTVVLLQMRSRDQARQALDAALALPDGRGTTRVRELATEGLDDESMVRAIRYLGEQHDAESVSLLTESLDAPLEVQRAAAGALAEIGPPAAQPAMTALGELLTAEDAALRSRAAWALARLGDGRGMDALIAAIAAGDAPSLPSYDPSALAELMGHDGLVQALAHTSGTVRQFAAYHLGAVCQPTDEPALVQAAQDADASVGSAAVVTLARCGMSAAPAQVSAMLSRDPSRWNALYSQMHREVGAPGLGMMLPHAPDAGARRALVQEIAQSFDPRAGEVLASELARSTDASERDRLDAGEALAASSDPRVVEVLEPLLASEDEDHARAAIAVLGHAADPSQVEARLLSLAASPGLRAAAIDAMTSAGVCSDTAQRTVQRWLTQRQVRSSALRMLGRCHHERASELARREVAEPLTPPITAEQGEYRLAALEVIAAMDPAQAAEVAPALLEQLEDASTDPRIRIAIADALGVVAPEAMRDGVLDRMLDARAPRPVRAAAFRLLRHGIAPASISRLIGFVRGGEDDERTQRAAILIGLASPAESRAELAGLLADERAKKTAALALALGADPAGAEALAALVRGDDTIAPGIARALSEPPWIFGADETGLHRALGAALANRDAGYGAPFSRLCEALGAPAPEGIGWRTPLERRRALLHDLTEAEDAATRVRAAEALVCTGARSAVLWARSRGERGAAEAQRALSDVRSEEPAAE